MSGTLKDKPSGGMPRLKRAYSPGEVLNMRIPRYEFTGAWLASIGRPARSGVWIVWGASGNGKSSFVMQLAKYLCTFGRVIYDSLEESTGLSLQMSLRRHRMEEVRRRLIILDREPVGQLEERLSRRGSPGVVIIDSFQYSGLGYPEYKSLKERHPKKLFIFISHAEGMHPAGRTARKVEYDADVKIMVSCFKAWCKSRFMEQPGEPYVIWDEGRRKPSETLRRAEILKMLNKYMDYGRDNRADSGSRRAQRKAPRQRRPARGSGGSVPEASRDGAFRPSSGVLHGGRR